MEPYGHHDYEHKSKLELRTFLGSLIDRALGCLSSLRPYARRAQQVECDVLHQEGVVLAYDIDYEATQDLPALCTRANTWMDKVESWVATVSATARGLWGKVRTHFTPRSVPDPTDSPSSESPPTLDQLVADVQDLKLRMTTLEGIVQNLSAEVRAGFQAIDNRFQQVEGRFAAAKQEREEGFAAAKQEREEGFAAAKQEREEGFAAAKQEREEGFAALQRELQQARLHRDHIMSDRRQGEDLEKSLQGFTRHIVNRTLRPIYGESLDMKILWADGDAPQKWYRIEQELELPLNIYANRIDRLIEIAWSAPGTPRIFLACEATLTLDHEHITKLENACRELVVADHHVIGILGYVKASASVLKAAQTTDLVLWRFANDIADYTEETTGPSLIKRLHALAATVTTARADR